MELGLFEYTVMPFGLANAPATFQAIIDKVLEGLSDIKVHYLDNVLIHTKGSLGDHCKAVERVLKQLIDNNLAINLANVNSMSMKQYFLDLSLMAKRRKCTLKS